MHNAADCGGAEIKKGQEPHEWTNVALSVRDLPRIDLGTLSLWKDNTILAALKFLYFFAICF